MTFWDAPGVLMTWRYWGVLVRCFVEWPSVGICLMFLSWLDQARCPWEKGHRGTGPFTSHCPEYIISTWLITDGANFDPLTKVCKVTVPPRPPSHSVLFGTKSLFTAMFKDWGVMLLLLEGEYLHKLFGILLYGSLSYSLYLYLIIIYLYQHGHIDIYFLLWVIN